MQSCRKMVLTCLCSRVIVHKTRSNILPLICQLSVRSAISPACCSHQMKYRLRDNSLIRSRSSSGSHIRSICFTRNLRGNLDKNLTGDSSGIKESFSDKIAAVVQDIVNEASVKYGDLGSMSSHEISVCLKTLVENGLPCEVLEKIAEQPGILHYPQQLIDLIKALKDLGMSKRNLVKMITNDSAVLTFDKPPVMEAFYKLLGFGFTSDLIVKMFVRQPEIIMANLDNVAKRIEELKLLFNTKHTFSLLTSNPGLLFSDMEDIRRKFMYVYNEMGVTQPQMMHTEIFNYPLEHIHTRHMFVVRTGYFRNVKEKEKFKNPRLDTILDSSDAAFAQKFGNMTIEDYQCFEALLLKEELLYVGEQHMKVHDKAEDDIFDRDYDDLDDDECLHPEL